MQSDSDVPYGYCHCRCGGKTTIPKKSIFARGVIKGVPMKFIHNHHCAKIPVADAAQPFKIDGDYCRFIPLTKGCIAIVDVADYEWLAKRVWQAQQASSTKMYYAVSTERGTGERTSMHRYITGVPEGTHVDHANRNTLDYRRRNLRAATNSQNQANRVTTKANKTGYRGVSWYKQYRKFVVMITHQQKKHFLGYFDLAEEGARKYDEKAKELFGEFARLNFPD